MVFPACAGVILGRLSDGSMWISVPRMCGGDPTPDRQEPSGDRCSPHVRG